MEAKDLIPSRLEVFRHFKGGLYYKLCIAQPERTPDDATTRLVIYADAKGNIWARPLQEFFGKVAGDTPRFVRVDDHVSAEDEQWAGPYLRACGISAADAQAGSLTKFLRKLEYEGLLTDLEPLDTSREAAEQQAFVDMDDPTTWPQEEGDQ